MKLFRSLFQWQEKTEPNKPERESGDQPEVLSRAERRASQRLAVDMPVRLGSGAEGRLVNISEVGVCVRSKLRRQVGELMELSLSFKGRNPLSLSAEIVRVEKYDAETCTYGAVFCDLSQSDLAALQDFLRWIQQGGQEPGVREVRPLSAREALARLTENVRKDRQRDPDYAQEMELFLPELEKTIRKRYSKQHSWEVQDADRRPYTCLHISADRMTALACILPPLVGERGLNREQIVLDLQNRRFLYKIPNNALAGAEYLHIVLLAEGTPPVHGVDGVLTELYDHRKQFVLESHRKQLPDFSASAMPQAVEKDSVICRIQSPVPGRDGMDVTGNRLPCRPASCPPLPKGDNTKTTVNGRVLMASVDGLLYSKDGLFCVHPQQVILDGLHAGSPELSPDGALRADGDLFIDGDVSDGVQVEAEGTIVISGRLLDGRVTSNNGSIRIQKGICGLEGQTFVSAKRQLQARIIQRADVRAGGDIVTERLEFSTVECGDLVRVTGGQGLIAGCRIYAGQQIICQRINGADRPCQFSLGCDPETFEALRKTQQQLTQMLQTQETLWGKITELNKKRSTLSGEDEAMLAMFRSQKTMCEQAIKQLKQQRNDLQKTLDTDASVHIRARELEPVLEVQIGSQTDRFTQRERHPFDIHIENRWISLERKQTASWSG